MRRHRVWVEEPICCCGAPVAGTPIEHRPRYKGYTKKRHPICLPDSIRHCKKNDALPTNSHNPSYETPRRSSRLSYERSVPGMYSKNISRNIYDYDDSSDDMRSFSETTQYTNGLSVDLTTELAAVTRDLEALITYGEKAHAMKLRNQVAGDRSQPVVGPTRLKEQERVRRMPTDQEYWKKVNQRQEGGMEPEQRKQSDHEHGRLLEMDRDPMERLQDIPLENLQPRKPAKLRENLAAKAPRIINQNDDRKFNTGLTTQSLMPKKPSEQNDVPRMDSKEFLKEMFQGLIEQKIIPKDSVVGNNVKKICANMEFDRSTEVKIDIDGLSTIAKSMPNVVQPSTISTAAPKRENSVSIQTQYDYDKTLSKPVQPQIIKEMGMGDTEQTALFQTLRQQPNIEKRDGHFKDGEYEKKSVTMDRHYLLQSERMVVPSEQKDLNIFCAKARLDTLINFKNYTTWCQSKENSKIIENKAENIGIEKTIGQQINHLPLDLLNSSKKSSDTTNDVSQNLHCKKMYSESSRKLSPDRTINFSHDNKNGLVSNVKSSSGLELTTLPPNNVQYLKVQGTGDYMSESIPDDSCYKHLVRPPTPKAKPQDKTSSNLTYDTTVEDQNKGNERADLMKSYSKSSISERLLLTNSEYANEASGSSKNITNIEAPRSTIFKNHLPERYLKKDLDLKENSQKLESSHFVAQPNTLHKEVFETKRTGKGAEATSSYSSHKRVTDLLKQLRSDFLKHIQTEVNHIEDLNRCIEEVGVEIRPKCINGESSIVDHRFK